MEIPGDSGAHVPLVPFCILFLLCFLGKQGKPCRPQTKKGKGGGGGNAGAGQETWDRILGQTLPWPPYTCTWPHFGPEGPAKKGQGGQEGAKGGQDRCQERDGVLAVADGNGLRKGPELRITYVGRDVVHRELCADYKTVPIRGRLCVPYGARMVVSALVCYYVCALLLKVERRYICNYQCNTWYFMSCWRVLGGDVSRRGNGGVVVGGLSHHVMAEPWTDGLQTDSGQSGQEASCLVGQWPK